jgi:hypothetical protein
MWLSVVATGKNSVCHHEPIKAMKTWRDVYTLWSGNEVEYIGVSDSSMGFHLGEILDRAQPRTLIVWRPVNEVEASLRRQGFPVTSDYCALLERRMNAFRGHPLVASVEFSALSDPDVVALCLRHLMPEAWIDINRIDDLMNKVIQVDPYETMASAAKRIDDLPSLLGEDVISEIRFL